MAAPTLDFRNTNSLWGSVLAETLVRLGVTQAVVAPGSRSAPLAFAFAGHPGIEAIPVLDERSAAFFALGLAKQSGRPVALACTSGTAAANFLPAVVEAWHSGVPLLVLTADRPPELRECSSGQTIDQPKLYGSHVNFYHEVAVPEAKLPALRYLRQTVAHAVERTLWPVRGPVHLNFPFRDPLPPVSDGLAGKLRRAGGWKAFFAHLAPLVPAPAEPTVPALPATTRGLVIAGSGGASDPALEAELIGGIAELLGWPVLADGLSFLRGHGPANAAAVTTYDTILRNPRLARRLRPDHVIVLGDLPVSKVLRSWLQACDVPLWFVHPQGRNPDALHGRSVWLRGTARAVLAALVERHAGEVPALGGYGREWLALDRRARTALDRGLRTTRGLFEGRAVPLLAEHLPAGTSLFVANSMPARDVEYFRPRDDRGLRLFFNRGANGIDGTLSSALGVAHGGRPAVLLTGDLALLHDANGFLLRPKFRGSLTIVLINNDGGGIFGHLPVAQFPEAFEAFFATPQEADFAKLCAAHRVEHTVVRSWPQFARLVSRRPRRGIRVLEIRTDRTRDAATRKAMFAAVAAGL
jgi:2-succinyl-5-enolpyruvyl-6-hydroxy-3-cyclohexene-1-carboxylate synthase